MRSDGHTLIRLKQTRNVRDFFKGHLVNLKIGLDHIKVTDLNLFSFDKILKY